jgi:pullulanase
MIPAQNPPAKGAFPFKLARVGCFFSGRYRKSLRLASAGAQRLALGALWRAVSRAVSRAAVRSGLRPGLMAGWAAGFAALCALASGPGVALAASPQAPWPARSECDAQAWAQTLVPHGAASPVPTHAQAYWASLRRLRWPGAPPEATDSPGGRWVLMGAPWGSPGLGGPVGGLVQGSQVRGSQVQGWRVLSELAPDARAWPAPLQARLAHAGQGPSLALKATAAQAKAWLRGALLLARLDAQGRVLAATRLQTPGVLDELYARAEQAELGVSIRARQAQLGQQGPSQSAGGAHTRFALWAPTAASVWVCQYPDAQAPAHRLERLQRDEATGVWAWQQPGDATGAGYLYLVDVWVPTLGWVRNRVTDPYALSFNANSQRGYITHWSHPSTVPEGWAPHRRPLKVRSHTDMAIYELHVRDFSVRDATVPAEHRGKFMAFTHPQSLGMQALRGMAQAGLTDVHLLPVFDIATIPEKACEGSAAPRGSPDGPQLQAAVVQRASSDCFNWGYDPLHFTAPEGSYATDADDGALRMREFRRMVMALHQAGLRVGMDVVYNHTPASGQHPHSVLDRIVPGYYQRLNRQGEVERSTCCDNTATEHRMMAKLMEDSVLTWVKAYGIDSFRFDLMGHQPRDVMQRMQKRANAAAGRPVSFIGEGWNFGEVANGARFVQASQLSLQGSGIGTFSDRGRDALRGGSPGDMSEPGLRRPGFASAGPWIDAAQGEALLQAQQQQRERADLIRLALAGSLRDMPLLSAKGELLPMHRLPYGDQPAGYAQQPGEVVNYTENHDNHTLFDALALKLPLDLPMAQRVRVQMLANALPALSQGVAYFHAGQEMLRSKSMDRNSYDSGDDFNRLDWALQDNGFGVGLPPAPENAGQWPLYAQVLGRAELKPSAFDIRLARDHFLDLLRLRASTPLLRLPSASEIQRRLSFPLSGPQAQPSLVLAHLEGEPGSPRQGAPHRAVLVVLNANLQAQTFTFAQAQQPGWRLHPVMAATEAADARVREQARHDSATGHFTVPGLSAVVFVR